MIIVLYALVSAVVGLMQAKRAGKSLLDYFLASRALPWWLAGTSIAATWFASDAPLAMVSMIRKEGLYANWVWWHFGIGVIFFVFFYAKLWRRAAVLTNAEFIELRYSGPSASVLRGFRAVYEGVLQNCIMMGWVMLAVAKFSRILLGWSTFFTLLVSLALVLLYTIASGLWGVVLTDLFQFIIGMAGCIAMAAVILIQNGGPTGMAAKLAALPDVQPGTLDMLPHPDHLSPLKFLSFVVMIGIIWLRQGEGGEGYTVQRIFATKNERHAVLAALWFAFAGIVILSLPWIIAGLGSLIAFPLDDPALSGDQEMAYPLMILKLLPPGLRGLLVVSFLAAFMSTMSTHLCWGGSYLVNDLYLRFVNRNASHRTTMAVSRLSSLLLAVLASLAAWQMQSIERAWYYLMQILAGIAVVSLLRWYWWRVNAWAEIAAIIGSVVLANANLIFLFIYRIGWLPPSVMQQVNHYWGADYDVIRALFIMLSCTFICLAVMFFTPPVEQGKLIRFYRSVRPAGWWRPIAALAPDVRTTGGGMPWLGWICGLLFLFGNLIGLTHLLIGRFLSGALLSALAVISFIFTYRIAVKDFKEELRLNPLQGEKAC